MTDLSWELYSRGGEIDGRTVDVTLNLRRWLVGIHVSRWKLLTGADPERTIHVHFGPLCLTTWKELA